MCHSPTRAPLSELARVVGVRRIVEKCFPAGENKVRFDQYEVRLWHAWYRHITLAMLAHAWLVVTAANPKDEAMAQEPPAGSDGTPESLVPLSVNFYRHR